MRRCSRTCGNRPGRGRSTTGRMTATGTGRGASVAPSAASNDRSAHDDSATRSTLTSMACSTPMARSRFVYVDASGVELDAAHARELGAALIEAAGELDLLNG